jgi:hypothetical protein
MAKAKKRAASRKTSAKRGKASANSKRQKTAKRAAPKKIKAKVGRARMAAKKAAVKNRRSSKSAARRAPKQLAQPPIETTIIDVIEEPVPGVVVITEYESVRTAPALSSNDGPKLGDRTATRSAGQ